MSERRLSGALPNVVLWTLLLVACVLSSATAQAQTTTQLKTPMLVNEGDIGWSATNPLQSNNAGRVGVAEKNPLAGMWAVAEVRFQGTPVDPLPPSRGRRAGVMIWTDGWTAITGFDGCNEFGGMLNVFSDVLEISASNTSVLEECGSLRYQGVIRRALSSSPKLRRGADEWSADVQGMYVRFVRSNPAEFRVSTEAFIRTLSTSAWKVRAVTVNNVPIVTTRPIVWQFEGAGPMVFDGCEVQPSSPILQNFRTNWRDRDSVEWTFDSGQTSERVNSFTEENGCPRETLELSTLIRRSFTNSFVFTRNGSTAVLTSAGYSMELDEVDKQRVRFRPFDFYQSSGTWTFVSLTNAGEVIQSPNRLPIRLPSPTPTLVAASDGCNTLRSSAFEFDGMLFGANRLASNLPCNSGARFTARYRALLQNAQVVRSNDGVPQFGDVLTLRSDSASATFTFEPWPDKQPPSKPSGPALTGTWKLTDVSVEGQRLPLAMPRVFAGFVSLSFRPNRTVDVNDGCNSNSGATYEVRDGRFQIFGGRTTLVYCPGAESNNTAIVVAAATGGKVTVTKSTMTFRQGDSVAVFRKTK